MNPSPPVETKARALAGQVLAGRVLVAAVGVALLAWTWRAWPDPVVDFGRELYVPWRLAEGDVLFRDIAWFNGPLSPYLNSLWFRCFGTGFMTLAWANLAILALAVALVDRILSRLAGPLAATIGCLLFLSMFAFAQLVGIANYNWMAPYSHEATHGLTLALVSFAAIDAWRRGGARTWLIVGGLALGLNFLTKPETFLAGGAAALVLVTTANRAGGLRTLAATAALPAALALGLLALALPIDQAFRGVLGAWPSVFDGGVSELAFYRSGMGLDDPGRRLVDALLWAGRWAIVLGPSLALGSCLKRRAPEAGTSGASSSAWAVGCAAATCLALWLLRDQVVWTRAGRPLALFAVLTAAALAPAAWRGRRTQDGSSAALAFAALSLALLLKMILHARIINYGFTLALPATLLASAALCGWIPAWLERRGRNGSVFAAGAAAALLFTAGMHVAETGTWLSRKTETVGSGKDAFRADLRGKFVNESVRSVTKGGVNSLAVLPEGIIFNYLARIPNPTPYVNFMPPELVLYGEQAWLEAFQAAPPDVVFLVHKDTSEYGFPYFGRDYGAELAGWVGAQYRSVGLIGDEPFRTGSNFGVRMLARGKQP